ncbi:quinone oxidoreductase family protein [Streptomyces iconiensis]|uniref:Alcohol dehydrogenase catalytic domain-containing protein n=1 Tax=Streptomyces iconiensis TaxID=1384038 RepID=A0ABT7A7G0_9ACTN|nr:alcohol dehydrogenase catalytic domain-containing protein [Streptomyces iconiensis]MDJ1136959.1 alcohol dehydrogenase catalytic domain-containing protein [Streptomyces iconiensis]
MSKAAGILAPGGPEALKLIDVAEPQAGAGQVRVRVRAAGVQPFDIAVVQGFVLPGTGPGFPRIPGNEFAGVIDQIGDGATGFALGDEVLGFGMLNGCAEYVVAGADQVTAKPAGMPWEVAGGFSAGAQTAHIALTEVGAAQ